MLVEGNFDGDIFRLFLLTCQTLVVYGSVVAGSKLVFCSIAQLWQCGSPLIALYTYTHAKTQRTVFNERSSC